MFDKFLESAINTAATAVSVVNALHFGVLKRMGLIEEAVTGFTETQLSSRKYNMRLDTGKKVNVVLHLETQADLTRFFDPTDDDQFLRWEFVDGSYISVPGLVDSAEVRNGQVRVRPFDSLEYSFEFFGDDGTEYVYHGEKKISFFNPINSWTSLKGRVYEKETGKEIVDSITFFGGGKLGASLLPFLKSFYVD